MEELQVVIEKEVGRIGFNFEEIKQFLAERLDEYRTAVFTDDSIKTAKSFVASLRKEQAAFKSRVTDVKKEFMQPFDEFKLRADELIRLYDEPINFINGQVSDFEERRKKQKREAIEQIYRETLGEFVENIPLDRIYNPKWENATCKEYEIKKEMNATVLDVKMSLKTLRGMESESVDKAVSMYFGNLELSAAVSYINNYERQKAEIIAKEQERQRREEEERIRREERRKIEEEMAQKAAEESHKKELEAAKAEAVSEFVESLTPEAVKNEVVSSYKYQISLSSDAKAKLEMYMDSVGIEYELI